MTIPAGGRVMVQGLTRAGTSLPVNVLVDELPSSELALSDYPTQNNSVQSFLKPVVNNSQSTPHISHDSSNDNFLQLFDEALHVNLSSRFMICCVTGKMFLFYMIWIR